MKKNRDIYRSADTYSLSSDVISISSRTPTQRYFDATDEINAIASSSHPNSRNLSKLHDLQQQLEQAEHDALENNNPVLALRIAMARVSSDLSARRKMLIANRDNSRFTSAFHELFTKNTFHSMAELADESLYLYENTPDLGRGRSIELSGVFPELTGLLISYDPDDDKKTGIPSSAHDDKESTGFHFDLMLYDLNQQHDFRRAADMKSRRHEFSEYKISNFARTSYADEVLANGSLAPIWDNSPYQKDRNLRTLRALIDMARGTASPETEITLSVLRDDFYYSHFEGHRKELADKMASHTLSPRYITSGTANRT